MTGRDVGYLQQPSFPSLNGVNRSPQHLHPRFKIEVALQSFSEDRFDGEMLRRQTGYDWTT